MKIAWIGCGGDGDQHAAEPEKGRSYGECL